MSIESGMPLKQCATRSKQKKYKNRYNSLPDHQHAEIWILSFVSMQQKRGFVNTFVIKFIGIIVAIIPYKNVSKIASNVFATLCILSMTGNTNHK